METQLSPTPGLLWVVLQNPLFSLHNQSLKEILVFKKLCQSVTSATASERGSFFSSFPFPLFNFYFVWTGVMPMYISVYHMCAWSLRRPEEDVRSPGTGAICGCEPLYGFWESDQHTMKSIEPSLLSLIRAFKRTSEFSLSLDLKPSVAPCYH